MQIKSFINFRCPIEPPLSFSGSIRRLLGSAPDIQTGTPLSKAVEELESIVIDDNIPEGPRQSNAAALRTLKDFLSLLRLNRPPAVIKRISFTDIHGNRFSSTLKTTGGECYSLVEKALGELFSKAGMAPSALYYDRDAFVNGVAPDPIAISKARQEALKLGAPSQMLSEEEFQKLEDSQHEHKKNKWDALDEADDWSEKLQSIDPLFAAVASIPWLPESQKEKISFIKSTVMDELEGLGWDVRGPVARIWKGERSLQSLVDGKDPGTKAAIQSLLYHTKQYEKLFQLKK